MKKIPYKLISSIILSIFSSLGSLPYGYRFAVHIFSTEPILQIIFGCIFSLAIVIANAALGTYSLTKLKLPPTNWYLFIFSFCSAIPIGFICYFGYQNLLPFSLNCGLSLIVTIVNIGIAYTAISDLVQEVKKTKGFSALSDMAVQSVGFSIGLVVSAVNFLAASAGVNNLLLYYQQNFLYQHHLAYIVGLIAWLPYAALFGHSNQIAAAEIYKVIRNFWQGEKVFSLVGWAIILLCLASGTSYFQIVHELFEPSKKIPEFLKTGNIEYLANNFLAPIAIYSNAFVNFVSLKKLLALLKKNKTKSARAA